jgi:hypothetical protein
LSVLQFWPPRWNGEQGKTYMDMLTEELLPFSDPVLERALRELIRKQSQGLP